MLTAADRIQSAPPPALDELKAIETFRDLPESGVSWLASVMHAIDVVPDEILARQGDPVLYLVVLLKGEIRAEREDGLVFLAHAGEVTGMLPYSRLKEFKATIRATEPTRIAALHKDLFPDVLERLPALQARLVSLLADRVREATAADQQREKLTALGKLSAGLAHELNNPAAAASRAADNLRRSLKSVRAAALKLDRGGLPQEARIFLAELEFDRDKIASPQWALDSLDRSDREEELAGWLRNHHIQAAWDLAAALVDLGCTRATLEEVATHVPEQFLSDALIRLTAAFTITRLADEIESSTGRISELVRAIKEYSYMDQAPEQAVDIHQGIESTLVMLRHRLKNGIDIVRDYDRSLPNVQARGSELNQIWTNLIVNAADAMDGKGKLTIRTLPDHNCARIEIIDGGPGIPDEIKSRIFEPFFTTKPVGEGTGLGLDIVSRIARNHRGDVSFQSRPGETRFIVRIPFRSRAGTVPSS